MTSVIDRPTGDPSPVALPLLPPHASLPAREAAEAGTPEPNPLSRGRVALVVAAWLAVTLAGIQLVLTGVGPLLEQRDQRLLLTRYRTDVANAANEAFGLPGTRAVTTAPATGTPVGIVDVGRIKSRQVVVEGAGPQQTRRGPGHVPGTAGVGQPGNAVVVGRRAMFGGPFGTLDQMKVGDRILVTTVQGQSVYEVRHVGRHQVVDPAGKEAATSAVPASNRAAADAPATGADEPLLARGAVSAEQLYGPSDDDRLTLVTSASSTPWSSDEALVVVATMDGLPFAPTPQGGRTSNADGRAPDPELGAPMALALIAYTLAVGAAVVCYRRLPWRSAYLLTAPPLVALTIVLAEQVTRALPAWA